MDFRSCLYAKFDCQDSSEKSHRNAASRIISHTLITRRAGVSLSGVSPKGKKLDISPTTLLYDKPLFREPSSANSRAISSSTSSLYSNTCFIYLLRGDFNLAHSMTGLRSCICESTFHHTFP